MTGFLFGGGAGTTVTATGGTIARSLSDIVADVINVKNFGALGNSTDGTDGQDDTTHIQAAVDALGVNSGEVFFPPGLYRITASIKLNSSGDNKSIILRGCGNASQIVGNITGFLIDKGSVTLTTNAQTLTSSNVLHFADTSSISVGADPGTHWTIRNLTNPSALPYPSYRVASKTSTTVTMNTVDDITPINAAQTVNSGDSIEFIASQGGSTNYICKLSSLFIKNTNASGGCVRLVGKWPAQVRDCYLDGNIGIVADQNSPVDVQNCKLNGIGGSGFGLAVGGESTVYKCDITGFGGDAIRAYGAAGSIIGCRCELNGGYGINLGTNSAGLNGGASGWLVGGNSLEGNGGGIYFNGVGYSTISGNLIHGEDANGSFAGLTMPAGGCSFTLISGLECYGDFGTVFSSGVTGHSIFIGFGCQGIVLAGVKSFISTVGHGTAWVLHAEDCTQYFGCNQPAPSSATFSSKPGTTGGGPMEGDLHIFTDSNTATFGATIAGGGANRVVGRYSSNTAVWTVVALAP